MDYRREREYVRWVVDDELYKFLSLIQAYIGGGCITSIFTGQPIADVDIFFRTEESYLRAVNYLNMCEYNKYRETRTVCNTEKAKTFSMSHNKKYNPELAKYGLTFLRKDANKTEMIIQLVRPDINCGEPEEIIHKFDITACQAAFDFKTDNFVLGNRFLQDIARRRVVINSECKNVIGAFFRIQKYIDKGYTVSPREYLKAAFMLANKNYKNYGEFVNDLKLSFQDPLIHHFYNKIRYPIGTRCAEKDSMMGDPFDASVVVEWIEEFNVAGPHYPVREGKDMTEEEKKDCRAPSINECGDVVANDIRNNVVNQPNKFIKRITPVAHSPKNSIINDDDDDDDDDYLFNINDMKVECVEDKIEK